MNIESPLQYNAWIEDALRDVIKRALTLVEGYGMPGDHHFYITFSTWEKGVSAATWIKKQYPEEMTIVIQHQYLNLKIDKNQLFLTLYFNGKPEHLVIPFVAITSFVDPSVNFSLQLKQPVNDETTTEKVDDSKKLYTETSENSVVPTLSKHDEDDKDNKSDESSTATPLVGKVIPLDTFRKK